MMCPISLASVTGIKHAPLLYLHGYQIVVGNVSSVCSISIGNAMLLWTSRTCSDEKRSLLGNQQKPIVHITFERASATQ